MTVVGDPPVRGLRTGVTIGLPVLAIVGVVALILTITKDDHDGKSLRDRVVDVEWTVVSVDGLQVIAERPPTFILQSDGRIVGFDGCNQYGFDLSEPGGWTLADDTLSIDQPMVSTAMACPDAPVQVVPIADGTHLALDAAGVLTMTSASGRLFTAAA